MKIYWGQYASFIRPSIATIIFFYAADLIYSNFVLDDLTGRNPTYLGTLYVLGFLFSFAPHYLMPKAQLKLVQGSIDINPLLFYFVFVLGLGIFLLWLRKNVASFEQLLFFMERYRNAAYKGSGIYTAMGEFLLPAFSTMAVLAYGRYGKFPPIRLLIPSLVIPLMVGQRVYLYPLALALLFVAIRGAKISKMAIVLFFILAASSTTLKYALDFGGEKKSAISYVLDPLTRVKPVYLAGYFLEGHAQTAPALTNQRADLYGSHQDVLRIALPNLDLTSGIATPFPVYLSRFGFGIGIILSAVVYFLISSFAFSLKKLRGNMPKVVSDYLLILLTLCYIEDFGFLIWLHLGAMIAGYILLGLSLKQPVLKKLNQPI